MAGTQRIRVAELLSWFRLVDFTVFPDSMDWRNGGVGGTIITNAGRLIMQDVELQVRRADFLRFGQTNAASFWYLTHEVGHATQFEQQRRTDLSSGTNLERHVNKLALDIATSLGICLEGFQPEDLSSMPELAHSAELVATLVRSSI